MVLTDVSAQRFLIRQVRELSHQLSSMSIHLHQRKRPIPKLTLPVPAVTDISLISKAQPRSYIIATFKFTFGNLGYRSLEAQQKPFRNGQLRASNTFAQSQLRSNSYLPTWPGRPQLNEYDRFHSFPHPKQGKSPVFRQVPFFIFLVQLFPLTFPPHYHHHVSLNKWRMSPELSCFPL